MAKTEIVTGTLINDQTVALDKPVRLRPMKVRVVIEPLEEKRRPYRPDILTDIYVAQAARGHRPPSREEVDRHIQSERDSWESNPGHLS
jgi:hypothetical protein